ncbi:hypothetical protein pb186bvf_013673 [Paramecium bursaria]
MGFKNDRTKKSLLADIFLMFQKLQTIVRQHLNLSKTIINILLAINILQPLTFVRMPIIRSQASENLIIFITMLVRPDYTLKKVNFIYSDSPLSFLFAICAQTLEYLLIIIILLAFWNQLIGNVSLVQNMKYWQRFILQALSIYSYLFSTILYIPFLVLLVESAHNNINNSTGYLILSILGIIYCILSQFQKVIFCSESVNLIIYGNEKLEFTKSEILKEVLIITQIFAYLLVTSFRVGEIIQSILALIISFIYLIQLFEYRIIGDRKQCLIIIITQSISISYILCNIFTKTNIFLYFTGLLLNLLLKLFQYQENEMYETISTCQRIKVIKQFMSFQINNSQETQKYQIYQAVALNSHKTKCQDQQCFCQKQSEYQEDPKRVNFLSIKLQTKFTVNRLKFMNQIINSDKSKQSEIHYLQYTSALNLFGQTTAAFQQCNQLLYGIEKQNNNSYVQSQAFSNRSFRSQSSSAKTQNKGSIDYKIQSIKQKQIRKSEKIYLKQGARNISEIGRYKLELLQLDIRTRMQQNFIKNQNSQQQEISEAVVLFLDSEEKNQSLKQQIVKSIEVKFKFYQTLLNRKNIQSLTLFNKAKDLSQKFIDLEEQLNYQYEQFPSQKLQSVICFFQAEILNNYLKAFKIANFNAVSDDKLINMRKNLKVNLFAKNVVYMIVKLQEGFQTLEICKKSNNAHEFFNYSFEEFQKNNYIDYLLPDAIRNEHMALVQRFIQTGSSRFFRTQNITFLKQSSGFIRPIHLFFDISTVQLDQLTFAVFFEELQGTQMFLLVDVNGYLSGISKSILEKLGFSQTQSNLYAEQMQELSFQKIEIIIPQFYRLINEEQKQYNVVLKYFHPEVFQRGSLRSYDKRSFYQEVWKNDANQQSFISTLTINKREIYGYYYYVIEFEDIKSTNSSNTDKDHLDGNHIEEVEKSKDVDSIHIDYSLEEADVNKPNAITIYQKDENLFDESSELNSKIQSRSFQIQQYYGVSGNATLNETAKNAIQQKFFNLNIQEQLYDEQSISQKEIKAQKLDANKIYEVDLDKIDKDMQDNIRMQLQLDKDQQGQENKFIDDIGSQVSSLAGVRKSAFFKKYDVICKLIQIQQLPNVFFFTNLLVVIYFLFTTIFFILVLSNTQQDFNRFLKETDMLTFNQAFMSPWDQFLNIRLYSSSYTTMLNQRLITNQTYQRVYNWLYNKLSDGYVDIKNNFLEQFSNDYIEDFFTDQYMVVRVQRANQSDLISKNITFRESLFMLLQYQFQSKTAYQQRKQIVDLPFTTYAWANYFTLHEQFNNMTIEIYQYTLVQKNLVSDKWTELWIIFLIMSFFIICINYYTYIKYRAYYEQYLDLFKYIDNFSLERDLEKYKILGSILNKDQDVMFKYVFDLEQKEKFMLTEKYKKEAQLKVTKEKRHGLAKLQKLPHLQSVLVFGILFSVFFTCSIIIQFQTIDYLNKYSNTATAYKKLAYLDLGVSSSFAHRLVSIYFRLYPFYVPSERIILYKQFNGCIQDIQDFMVEFTSFNDNDHLTTQSFINLLESVKTGPICNILPDEIYQDVQYYCPLAYQGALQQGLFQSLNYIINYLLTDQQINNFTLFTNYTLYDIEGVYIIQKATKILMQEMKYGLVSATELKMSSTSGLSVFYVTYAILALIVQLLIISKYLIREFRIVKRFILLLPSSTKDVLEYMWQRKHDYYQKQILILIRIIIFNYNYIIDLKIRIRYGRVISNSGLLLDLNRFKQLISCTKKKRVKYR